MKFFTLTHTWSAARRCRPAHWATWFLVGAMGGVVAQTAHYSIEPNQTKAEATFVTDARSSDTFGTTFPFPSLFRIRTAAAPLGIYRCQLVPAPPSFMVFTIGEITLRGRTAITDAVDPNSDVTLQTTGTISTTNRSLTWYGFGKSEEIYTDIAVVFQSRGGYQPAGATLIVTLAPEVDLGVLVEQPLELVARPMTGGQDLELAVFDAEFNALPYASIDDSAPGNGSPRLQFDALPGLYHIAVADREMASHLAPSALDLRVQSSVLDFAGAFACSSSEQSFDIELALEPAGGGPPLARATAPKIDPYEVLWFRVQIGQGQSFQSYCPGDGSGGTCACLGDAPDQSGMGCRNSSGRGATVVALDHLQPGQWRVTLEDLPANTLALGFIGLQVSAQTPYSGGLSCIAPGAVRVALALADAAGTAVIPAYDPTASGFLAGQTLYLQGAYRDTLAPAGCAVNFTNGFSFVAR